MLLKNVRDIDALIKTIERCRDTVILRSRDGCEEFDMKSTLAPYLDIRRLQSERGDNYEFFCMNKADEGYMLKFFYDMKYEAWVHEQSRL